MSDLELTEQWRAGGEDDDEIFFGNVLQVLSAPDGGVYVLDSQLLQVFAFTAEGDLRTILGGRVVVVKGAVEAYRREQNTERAADALEVETTLEVICYAPVVE